MNTPQSITVDLDHAKKLKEAGWYQNSSVHQWYRNKSDDSISVDHRTILALPINKIEVLVDAPTAEEILRRLPDMWPVGTEALLLTCCQSPEPERLWVITYSDKNGGHPDELDAGKGGTPMIDQSLANAAAAMWIYLKSNSLLP